MATYARYLLQIACLAVAISLIFYGAFRAGALEQPFDHTQCRYPDRESNPIDACDNSTPNDPSCTIKTGKNVCEAISEPIAPPAPLYEPAPDYIPPETGK